jgi:hypothetical protein
MTLTDCSSSSSSSSSWECSEIGSSSMDTSSSYRCSYYRGKNTRSTSITDFGLILLISSCSQRVSKSNTLNSYERKYKSATSYTFVGISKLAEYIHSNIKANIGRTFCPFTCATFTLTEDKCYFFSLASSSAREMWLASTLERTAKMHLWTLKGWRSFSPLGPTSCSWRSEPTSFSNMDRNAGFRLLLGD